MSMLDVHAEALEGGSDVYHEFLLRYRKNDQVVYGIVEGKDDPVFYQGLIENFLPAGWDVHLIKSGNRSNVLKSLGGFDWGIYPKKRICFFVDRDLSMFRAIEDPVSENLFVTEKYSIENEAATFGTVSRILHDVLNVATLSHDEAVQMRRLFSDNLERFQEAMTPIMAQVICWQRSGKKTALDNINPKDLFEFEKGSLRLRPKFIPVEERLNYVASKVGCALTPPNEFAKVEKEFRKQNGKELYVRGKYILWFVVETCLEFHRHIQLFSKFYTVPPKVKITMGHANAMVLVAPRIRCPEQLNNFLKSSYGEYIDPPVVPPMIAEEEGSKESPRKTGFFSGLFQRIMQKVTGQ